VSRNGGIAGLSDGATRLGQFITSLHWQIAVAESLTGGQLSATIAPGIGARRWLKGGVVAYQRSVKQHLLGVSDGLLVSRRCACEMAIGVATLLHADIGLAITGVGGPQPDEGHDAGTVWIALHAPVGTRSQLYHLPGDSPDEICAASCARAVEFALTALADASSLEQ